MDQDRIYRPLSARWPRSGTRAGLFANRLRMRTRNINVARGPGHVCNASFDIQLLQNENILFLLKNLQLEF